MQAFEETIDFTRVAEMVKAGCRVSLFVRHSERPPIDPTDAEFGRTLALTPRGVEIARDAGKCFAGIREVRFMASPMVRCQMTAQCIAEGMGLSDVRVTDEPRLGLKCFYYEEPEKLQAAMRQQGYLSFMLDYLHKGVAPYSRPLDVATGQMVAWLKGATVCALNVLVSHDIFVASLLSGLKVRNYSPENWVGFVHGAAVVHTPGGDWVCYPCVPQIAEAHGIAFLH